MARVAPYPLAAVNALLSSDTERPSASGPVALVSALVVDPSMPEALAIVSSLTACRFHVTVAETFSKAKERMLAHVPQVLLTEVRLAEYNGLHLVLRGKAARRDLAAIVTSGVADQVLQAEAEQLGATFVLKPTTAQEFSAAICRTLLQATGGPIRSPFERRTSDRRSTSSVAFHPDRRKASRRRDVLQLIQQVAPM